MQTSSYELWAAAARPVLGNPEVEAFRAYVLSRGPAGPAAPRRLFLRISAGASSSAAAAFDSLGLSALLFARAPEASAGPAPEGWASASRPPSVALVGPMASGKSSVGPLLAARLGLPFADSDAAVEAASGLSIPAIFAAEGEAGFRAREREAIAGLLAKGPSVIATGGGAVLSAESRDLLKAGAAVVWLHASPEALGSRLEPGRRPLLECADPFGRLASIYRERIPYYAEVSDFLVPTEGAGPEAIAEVIHEEILRASRD